MKVIFYTVKDSNAKVRALLSSIDRHTLQKEKIKIVVPDTNAIEFVSDLLWKEPKESFRPHSKTVPLLNQELILLSLPLQENDDYSIVFNLSQGPYTPSASVRILYELEDLSHPQKAALFQKKFQVYQQKGYTISAGIF
jgi:DNA polymerase IIIc chi subunit